MLKKVLLIGGGEIINKETLSLDKQFIKLAGGNNAIIGFFPTAANDSEEYIDTFKSYYLGLGCKEVIPVKLRSLKNDDLKKILENMTGIYLGGGNTSLLMSALKEKGADQLLKIALSKGMVIAGMSAGALAACDYFIDPDKDGALKVSKGLGLQHLVICVVHFDPEKDIEILRYLKKNYPKYKVVGIKEKQGLLV